MPALLGCWTWLAPLLAVAVLVCAAAAIVPALRDRDLAAARATDLTVLERAMHGEQRRAMRTLAVDAAIARGVAEARAATAWRSAGGTAAGLLLVLALLHAAARRRRRDGGRDEITALLADGAPVRSVFQPILDLRTGQVSGYEALARFGDGSRAPDAWIEQAHRAGLGPQLEAVALRAALAAARSRPAQTYLALNLSPSALLSRHVQAALPADLRDVLIEITENERVTDDAGLQQALARLRERGARIAVDDAGAGYAGFQQLMRLRPDVIKVDRSLVQDIANDPVKVAVVTSFVGFARRIGAEVCAEGVETPADLRTLADLDVALGQGYGIARPAAPWAHADSEAVDACRAALADALDGTRGGSLDLDDRRLERLVRRLSSIDRGVDLDETLALLGRELGADQVHLCELAPDGAELVTVSSGRFQGDRWSLEQYPATARLLAHGGALQILASDPLADAAELDVLTACGGGSMLVLPVRAGGRSVGLLELVAESERSWSRAAIERARIVSYALGGFIESRANPRSLPAC